MQLPMTMISPPLDSVRNDGRSADTSHLYFPLVSRVTFLSTTLFRLDWTCYKEERL